MTTPTLYEQLQQEIESLPLAMAEEVLDFVLFIKARRDEEMFLWHQVEETREYRQQHPEEVMIANAEQWDALTDQNPCR